MITAVLLAAGKGSRMGVQKQTLTWGEKTILKETIDTLLSSDYIDDQLSVVLGDNAEKIKKSLTDYTDSRIKIMINPDFEAGMHTTIKKGIENFPKKTEVFLIALGDQPLIDREIYEKIIKKFLEVDKKMLVPTYKGKRGHPVMIKKDFLLDQIDDISGAGGLRSLIDKTPDQVFSYEIDKKEIVIDLDYYDEYKLYRKKEAVKNNSWFLNYKFWLEGKEKIFGDGPCDILARIDRFGSLSRAAEDMNMSYSQAWKLINRMEERLGFKLIEKRVGGRSGGGSVLTEKGRKLMNDFLSFRREIHDHIIRLEEKYFAEWQKKTPEK